MRHAVKMVREDEEGGDAAGEGGCVAENEAMQGGDRAQTCVWRQPGCDQSLQLKPPCMGTSANLIMGPTSVTIGPTCI